MNFQHQIINELHKPVRRYFPRRNTLVKSIDDLHQADLVEMIPYSKENRGYKYIMTVINCFTKVADAYPLKNKSATAVSAAMKKYLLKNKNKVINLQTDMGKEFYNTVFKNLMKKHKINHYSTFSEIKAAIVERFNRTLKSDMYKRFSLRGSYKWYDILTELIKKYNNKIHRTIQMKPNQVNKANEDIVRERILQATTPKSEAKPPKRFSLGDTVRISKSKSIFDKKYFPNWTNEVFTIFKVQPTFPESYILKDKDGETLQGGFYGHELLKSKTGNVYLIEKVLKRARNKVLVRWLGFDKNSKDEWIDKSKLL